MGEVNMLSLVQAIARQTAAGAGSVSLTAPLGLTLAVSVVHANVTPYTVTSARRDEPLAVLPKMEATAPSDAQIAYVLARFVKNVRSLSIDPVVVRKLDRRPRPCDHPRS